MPQTPTERWQGAEWLPRDIDSQIASSSIPSDSKRFHSTWVTAGGGCRWNPSRSSTLFPCPLTSHLGPPGSTAPPNPPLPPPIPSPPLTCVSCGWLASRNVSGSRGSSSFAAFRQCYKFLHLRPRICRICQQVYTLFVAVKRINYAHTHPVYISSFLYTL